MPTIIEQPSQNCTDKDLETYQTSWFSELQKYVTVAKYLISTLVINSFGHPVKCTVDGLRSSVANSEIQPPARPHTPSALHVNKDTKIYIRVTFNQLFELD